MTPTSDYPELRNLHALKAMGITVYHPRFRLPGAAESRVCDWPVTVMPPSVAEKAQMPQAPMEQNRNAVVVAVVAAKAPASPRVPLSVKLEVGLPDTSSAPIAEPEKVALVRTSQADAGQQVRKEQNQHGSGIPAFQALLSPVNERIAVLTLMPALASPGLQDKEAALLNNILRWLGMPSLAPRAPHVFRWPLPGVKLVGQADAGLGLQAFLDQAAQEFGARQILVFGQLLHECLDAAGSNNHGLHFTATYSLNELLNVPQLKREAWQTLLPLHSQLRAGNVTEYRG